MRTFLTHRFNLFLPKFSYFIQNNFTLKRLLLAALIIPALVTRGQSYNNIEFIENKGQWDSRIQYKGNVSNGALLIREGGFTVIQHHPGDYAALSDWLHGHKTDGSTLDPRDKFVLRSHAWDVNFVGASKNIKTVADKSISTYNNYFIGSDQSKWAANCRIYQAITLEEVYPNIDVRYYTDNGFLKYDIIVKPGGDVSRIALKYDGVDKLQVKNKELMISTSLGELKESSPYTYQASSTGKNEISCKYSVKDNIVRFDVKNYDPTATLIIDPVVVFCSFSGSTADSYGFTATYGPDGSMFGGGIVFDPGWKVSTGAYQTTFQGGAFDMGIIKLTPDGRNRVYATYIGGSGEDQPHSLVVDPQGNLVIAGRTSSGNYPIVNPGGLVGTGGGYDIVVTKLNTTGTGLVGSKKIGGSGDDGVNISTVRTSNSLQRNYGDDGRTEVILDGAGNVYVASCTRSTNFPFTAGAFQIASGGQQDGVVLKLTPTLSAVSFASYLGGNRNDAAYVLALGPGGNIYVAGGTESSDLPGPTAGTVSPGNNGGIDGFVSIVNSTGTAITRTTYIGTGAIDQIFGIQFDRNGFPYVMGQTTGTWPIINATYNNPNGKQFIVKLQPDLSSRIYSTAFGSGGANPNISPTAFLVDRCENVYVSGWGGHFGPSNPYSSEGTAGLPVTPDALKSTTDGKDFYFFVLKKDATAQLFGSFFGENNTAAQGGTDHVDGGTSRFDPNGVIYQAICGNCDIGAGKPFYPTTAGAWSTANNSPSCDLVMVKIAMNLAGVDGGIQSSINGQPRDTTGCLPLVVDFTDTIGTAQSYEWYFNYVPGNPPDLVTTVPTATSPPYTAVGSYLVMLVAIDPSTCNVRDSSFVTIHVADGQASPAFTPVKLPPCTAFDYRFDNNSIPPPSVPFGPASFVWDFGDNSPRITAGGGPVFHTFPGPGTYNVTLLLQDVAYCNAPDSVTVALSVASNVVARFTTPSTGCLPYTAGFRNTSDAGETWLWNFGDPASGANNTSTDFEPTHLYSAPGTYIVTLTANNPNTCNLTSTTTFTITVYDSPTPGFSFSPSPPVENSPTTFVNTSSPDAIRFKWDFGDGDTLLTTSRAPVIHQYNATGTFTACLTAYNLIGCDSTICKPVDILIVPVVGVPNAFTPQSGDGNSVVMVRGFGIAKMQFIIWNRWGQKVFETNNRLQGWDGKVKGVIQPMDVYAYTLSIEFSDGTKKTMKGDITLIR